MVLLSPALYVIENNKVCTDKFLQPSLSIGHRFKTFVKLFAWQAVRNTHNKRFHAFWSRIVHPHIHQLLPARLISALAGFTASITTPWFKNAFIRQFIRAYGVNMQEALHVRAEDYRNFNDFFTRKLRTGARPVLEMNSVY